ncbi:MAG: hypothetical protein U0Z26_10565 [Anaerolineales bacterium]
MAKKTDSTKKRTPKKENTRDVISVSETGSQSAVAAGENAKANVIIFNDGWKVVIAILAIAIVVLGFYFGWQWLNPEKMTGAFRIAVAGFETEGNSDSVEIGQELSFSIFQSIEDSLSTIQKKYDIHIWGPEQIGKVSGNTPEERSKSAQAIAESINANIIIYGYIDATAPIWKIYPEFYISSTNSVEVEEVTGQYDFGQAIEISAQENDARRFEINEKFSARSQAISNMMIGLLYFSIRDYAKALEAYQFAEKIEGWEDDQGKAVLYLLMGNAASKGGELDLGLGYLNDSLKIDSEYARPYITIAGVYYLQAMNKFDESGNKNDVDQQLLLKSIDTYKQALSAKHKPKSSDVETKVHFGLGQCYLMQAYGGEKVNPNLAAYEFQIVIDAYRNGENPRVRELAAESHARLGLLYLFSGKPDEASGEYQLAADLLFDNPERQQQYQSQADKYH